MNMLKQNTKNKLPSRKNTNFSQLGSKSVTHQKFEKISVNLILKELSGYTIGEQWRNKEVTGDVIICH